MRGEKRVLIVTLQLLLLATVIVVWEIGARLHWLDPFFFSQPSVFGARALQWLTKSGAALGGRSIYHHLLVTMEEMAGGLFLGVAFGPLLDVDLGQLKPRPDVARIQ